MQPGNPQGEAAAVVTPEPSAAPQAPGSEAAAPQTPVNEPAPATPPKAEDVDALRKELEKVTQERNLHKNQVEKFNKAQEEARQAELSEVERLKEQLAGLESDKQQREARDFRDTVLNEYLANDPAALKAAKALIAKNPLNLAWGEGLTEDEAKAELLGQLDALKEVVGTPSANAETPTPPAHANNPGSIRDKPDTQTDAIAQARKTGDWSKVIGTMNTVKFQNAREY